MMNKQQQQVKRYMRQTWRDHRERETGEVIATPLAEDAAWTFGHNEWLDDETHWVWDLAVEVAEEFGPIVW